MPPVPRPAYARLVQAENTGRRRGAVAPALGGLTFLGLSLWNAQRSYDYDESVTVGFFVEKSNLVDAVTSQIVFNNHPLLTALNWVVFHLGGTTETWQRLPSALAGAACVAVVGLWTRRRFGTAPCVVAMSTLVAFPLLLELSRQARGYSLLALIALSSTILLVDDPRGERFVGRRRALYGALVCLGLLSHLYFAIVLVGHAAWIHRATGAMREGWLRTTALGGALAAFVYLPMIPEFREASTSRSGGFLPGFPWDALQGIFGTPAAAVLGTVLVADLARRSHQAMRFAVASLAAVAIIWTVVQPLDLYPRFLVWVVPLAALLAGRQARRRVVTLGVTCVLALSLPGTLEMLREESSIRDVVTQMQSLESEGAQVCAVGHFWMSFQAYAHIPPAASVEGCDAFLIQRDDLLTIDIGDRVAVAVDGAGITCVVAAAQVLAGLHGGPCPVR